MKHVYFILLSLFFTQIIHTDNDQDVSMYAQSQAILGVEEDTQQRLIGFSDNSLIQITSIDYTGIAQIFRYLGEFIRFGFNNAGRNCSRCIKSLKNNLSSFQATEQQVKQWRSFSPKQWRKVINKTFSRKQRPEALKLFAFYQFKAFRQFIRETPDYKSFIRDIFKDLPELDYHCHSREGNITTLRQEYSNIQFERFYKKFCKKMDREVAVDYYNQLLEEQAISDFHDHLLQTPLLQKSSLNREHQNINYTLGDLKYYERLTHEAVSKKKLAKDEAKILFGLYANLKNLLHHNKGHLRCKNPELLIYGSGYKHLLSILHTALPKAGYIYGWGPLQHCEVIASHAQHDMYRCVEQILKTVEYIDSHSNNPKMLDRIDKIMSQLQDCLINTHQGELDKSVYNINNAYREVHNAILIISKEKTELKKLKAQILEQNNTEKKIFSVLQTQEMRTKNPLALDLVKNQEKYHKKSLNALNEIIKNGYKVETLKKQLSDRALKLLTKGDVSPERFQKCTGNQYKQAKYDEAASLYDIGGKILLDTNYNVPLAAIKGFSLGIECALECIDKGNLTDGSKLMHCARNILVLDYEILNGNHKELVIGLAQGLANKVYDICTHPKAYLQRYTVNAAAGLALLVKELVAPQVVIKSANQNGKLSVSVDWSRDITDSISELLDNVGSTFISWSDPIVETCEKDPDKGSAKLGQALGEAGVDFVAARSTWNFMGQAFKGLGQMIKDFNLRPPAPKPQPVFAYVDGVGFLTPEQAAKQTSAAQLALKDLATFFEETSEAINKAKTVASASQTSNDAVKNKEAKPSEYSRESKLSNAKEIFSNSKQLKELEKKINELKNTVKNKNIKSKYSKKDMSCKEFDKLEKIAEETYNTIRNSKQDISEISKNTGLSENIVSKIKDHVFIEKHILNSGLSQFPADIDIADAWYRLKQGNFTTSDLVWMQHEYAESLLMNGDKVCWRIAHDTTNKYYNWQALIE